MTDDREQRLREIRARHAASTPGHWYPVTKGNSIKSHAIVSTATEKSVCSGISPKTGNALFIADAHQDVPWLLAEIELLEQVVRNQPAIQLMNELMESDPQEQDEAWSEVKAILNE